MVIDRRGMFKWLAGAAASIPFLGGLFDRAPKCAHIEQLGLKPKTVNSDEFYMWAGELTPRVFPLASDHRFASREGYLVVEDEHEAIEPGDHLFFAHDGQLPGTVLRIDRIVGSHESWHPQRCLRATKMTKPAAELKKGASALLLGKEPVAW